MIWLLACTPPDQASEPAGRSDSTSVESVAPFDSPIDSPTDSPVDSVDPECVDVPLVTYATFGEGFLTFTCQGCHGSGSQERFGAPEQVTFDTHEQVLDQLDRIYVRTVENVGSMPPAGGVPESELELLGIWIDCWDGR